MDDDLLTLNFTIKTKTSFLETALVLKATLKQTHRLQEWTLRLSEGWGRDGIVLKFGIDMYTLLYSK